MTDNVAGETWAVKMQSLALGEQAEMLSAATRLLRHPEAISTPLEAETRILAEQICAALGKSFTA